MANPTKVEAAKQMIKPIKGPSGFGSVVDEERTLKAADAGTTYGGWVTGPTGATGSRGASPTGPTGPTGP